MNLYCLPTRMAETGKILVPESCKALLWNFVLIGDTNKNPVQKKGREGKIYWVGKSGCFVVVFFDRYFQNYVYL